MLILSLDSAGSLCSVCVWRDGVAVAQKSEQMERGQDQRLMPLVLEIMQQAAVDFDDLDRIAVTRGPGSFTGLRIGLAAARGMGLAANKPVIGIDRFAIYHAQHQQPSRNLLVIIHSKRAELFCRFYPASGAAAEPNMLLPDEIIAFLAQHPDTLIAGDAILDGHTTHGATEPEVITCATLAAQVQANDPAFAPQPLYLRAPDVTLSPKAQPVLDACRE